MNNFCNSKKLTLRLVLLIVVSTVLLLTAILVPMSFAAWTSDLDADYAVNGVGIGHWTAASQGYNITVAPCTNGLVTVSTTEAEAGTEIIVNATPNSGYICSSLTYSYNGKTENIMPEGDVFKFVMPEADVTINGTFTQPASVGVTNGVIVVRNGVKIPYAGTEDNSPVSNVEVDGIRDGDIVFIYFGGSIKQPRLNGNAGTYFEQSGDYFVFKAPNKNSSYRLEFTIAGSGIAINNINATEL